MARTVGIDRGEVFETANRLEAEGKEVTALTMLAALGRGSLTTIYKYLDAWRESKPVKNPIVQVDQPEMVKTAFATAWRVAAEEAARETMVIREKAADEINAALRQFHGALEAIAKLEADREADADIIEGLQKIAAEQKAENAKLETEAATARWWPLAQAGPAHPAGASGWRGCARPPRQTSWRPRRWIFWWPPPHRQTWRTRS